MVDNLADGERRDGDEVAPADALPPGPDAAAEHEPPPIGDPPVGGSGEVSAEPESAAGEQSSEELTMSGEDVSGEDVSGEDVSGEDVQPLEDLSGEADAEDPEADRNWYILKVQSNRERTVCDALRRRVQMNGLEEFFGEILVPTEDVAEFKNGKRKVMKRKLYPGYVVVNMSLNDETWFTVRETPGIGDFTGAAGKPVAMLAHEVERIRQLMFPDEERDEPIKTAIPYRVGDRVRIKEGTFENFEGDVDGLDEANGRVTVMINIFGRSTPVELEHWQIESV